MTINLTMPETFSPVQNNPKKDVKNIVVQNSTQKTGLLDKFETSIRNSADLNDTVVVPRTIFKGYLSVMSGSILIPLAMMAKNKHPKVSNVINIISSGLMLFGTYSFTRPYLFNDLNKKK